MSAFRNAVLHAQNFKFLEILFHNIVSIRLRSRAHVVQKSVHQEYRLWVALNFVHLLCQLYQFLRNLHELVVVVFAAEVFY